MHPDGSFVGGGPRELNLPFGASFIIESVTKPHCKNAQSPEIVPLTYGFPLPFQSFP
jgi:hypothetical protein